MSLVEAGANVKVPVVEFTLSVIVDVVDAFKRWLHSKERGNLE